MNENWAKKEVSLIVHDYFKMLHLDLNKEKYNKTSSRVLLLPQLNNRSEGSIEFKHQNISAILAQDGMPFIKGYKPRFNYQGLLEEEVLNYLSQNKIILEKEFEKFSDEVVSNKLANEINFENILDEESNPSIVNENEPSYRPIKINYLERE